MKSFQNKVAVVTGAGSGIGRELSVQLAQRGAWLALSDLNPDGLDGTAASIADLGGQSRSYIIDVADRRQMYQLADDVDRDYGQVDILINNAGVTLTPKLFEDITDEQFDWLISINMWGVFNGVRAFLPYLRERAQASIVNVDSLAGLVGLMGYTPYVMAKSAVRGLSEALQMELAKTNITVTVVYPGGVKTDLMKNAPDYESEEQRRVMTEYFQKAALLTPEKVSKKIIRAIEKKKYRLVLGADAKLVYFIRTIFPNRFPDILNPIFGRMTGTPPVND